MCDCSYCTESEEENSFWHDVYSYMDKYSCSKDEAIEFMRQFYFKE